MAVFPFTAAFSTIRNRFPIFSKTINIMLLKSRSKTSFMKQIILCQFTDTIENGNRCIFRPKDA